MSKLDIFCHIFPRSFVKGLGGSIIPKSFEFLSGDTETAQCFVDGDERVRRMDRYGIEIEALTVSLTTVWTRVPASETMRVTRLANDSLAQLAQKHRDRLVPIAAIPDQGSGEALDELDRAINDLGMKGCMIFSNVRGRPIDSPEFDEFYGKMEKFDLPILLHPATWTYYDWIREHDLIQIFGWPFDTSLAMARLVFGGVMERHPGLKVVCHHVGAMIPHFAERIRGMYDVAAERGGNLNATGKEGPQGPRLKKHPMEYFRQFYGDTTTNGGLSELRCGYEFFGAEHLLFATDYPFGPQDGERWLKSTIKNVEDLEVTQEERELIFERNARRILKLD